MSEVFVKRYYTIPRNQIGLLRFLLESYDGLAFARTLDRTQGLVEIAFAASRARDVEGLLQALHHELGLRDVAPPAVVPPL